MMELENYIIAEFGNKANKLIKLKE
jgi:hypothetical protein